MSIKNRSKSQLFQIQTSSSNMRMKKLLISVRYLISVPCILIDLTVLGWIKYKIDLKNQEREGRLILTEYLRILSQMIPSRKILGDIARML